MRTSRQQLIAEWAVEEADTIRQLVVGLAAEPTMDKFQF